MESQQKKRMRGKRGKSREVKTRAYSQYGYDSSGVANLISQKNAMEHKADLKNLLEHKFREVVDKYLKADAKKVILEG